MHFQTRTLPRYSVEYVHHVLIMLHFWSWLKIDAVLPIMHREVLVLSTCSTHSQCCKVPGCPPGLVGDGQGRQGECPEQMGRSPFALNVLLVFFVSRLADVKDGKGSFNPNFSVCTM